MRNLIEDKKEESPAKSQSVIVDSEDSKYIIRDTITGIAYDIRSQSTAIMLNEVDQMLTKLPGQKEKKPWEEWWREKRENNHALLDAAERGDVDKIVELIDESKHGDLIADINAKGLDDFAPLHFAASEGQLKAVEVLLLHHASTEAVTTSLRTPLHIACNRKNLGIVDALVNSGSNINAQDEKGDTPTHILSRSGWSEALGWFLTKSPDLSIKNTCGETSIEAASSIEIRQMFASYTKIPGKAGDYSRTVMEGVILRNSRVDVVNRVMMLKDQFLGSQSLQKPEIKSPEVKAAPAAQKHLSRIIKILEAAERMKSLSPEETKTAPSKGEAKSEGVAPSTVKTKVTIQHEADYEDAVGPEEFEPLSLLGKGSFGEVYLVKHKPTGNLYAMKVLNKRKVMAQNLIKYARTERNVLCITKHPFIVGLNFAFQNSEKLFMIMEYCPGGDLGRLVQKERRVTEERARIYIAEILLALEDLHKRDIIFRDLKPDNVVLDEDGHALLTDFGNN